MIRWKNACQPVRQHTATRKQHVETHREDNQHHHQCALGDRTRVTLAVTREEEQRGKQDLFNVQAHKHMLDRHREEPSTAVGRARLAKLPEEPVLPEHVEQEERRRGEAIDDRRDDRVRQGCGTDRSKQI